MQKKDSLTWLLFASGKYAGIDTYIYPASPESSRPIDAYIVSECQGDFTKSARRAADIIYHIFRESHGLNPMVVGYDIHTMCEHSLTGRSGGLSFAVSFAKELLMRSGNNDPGDVAATGELLSKGEIGAIDGINAKAEAASQLLTKGSYFFYPSVNHEEIDISLIKQLQAKGVNICAIKNISEVISHLKSSSTPNQSCQKIHPPTRSTIKSRVLLLFCTSTLILLSFLALKQYFKKNHPEKNMADIIQQRPTRALDTDKSEITLTPRKLKERKISAQQSIKVEGKPTKETHIFRFAPPMK